MNKINVIKELLNVKHNSASVSVLDLAYRPYCFFLYRVVVYGIVILLLLYFLLIVL